MTRLQDKVVLITGASSGIGRAAALCLASRGAHVALAARRVEALREVASQIEHGGGKALVTPTDVTDPKQTQTAITHTVEQFGRLDVLICSAGVSMRANFADTSFEAIDQVMRINFFGTLYPTWQAIPYLKATRGSLVAVSSLVGKRGTPTYSIYGASKFAVQGLYESLRVELAPDGIHVGVVSPGHVDTPLRESVLGPDGKPWPTSPPTPFRVWPLQRVVNRLIRLIEKRKPEALVPGWVGPLLTMDRMIGPWLGDYFIDRQFRRYPLPEYHP
jgi:NAD(P)-dependent dehydrogenase (short-subunit alcohol dehydrogenase family)